MYIQEITLNLSPDLDADLMIDEFNWLTANYHKNGQILSGSHTQYLAGTKIICLPYTLERDSLDAKNNNNHVTKQIERIEMLCGEKLAFRTIGRDQNHVSDVCTCKPSSHLLLTATSFSRDSAILCGECRLSVPLYNLPKTDDDNYVSILNWQLNSMICDGFVIINLNNKIPTFPNNILQAVDKTGYEICQLVEEKTGIKTRLFHKLGTDKNFKSDGNKHMAE